VWVTAAALRAVRDLPDITQTAPLVNGSCPTGHHVCSFCSYMQIAKPSGIISTCIEELSNSVTRKDVTIVAKRMFANQVRNVQPLHVYIYLWNCYGGYVSMHRYGQTYTAITNPLYVTVKRFAIKRESGFTFMHETCLSCLKSVLFFVVLSGLC